MSSQRNGASTYTVRRISLTVEYRASVSRDMPVYYPSFAAPAVLTAPSHGGTTKLT